MSAGAAHVGSSAAPFRALARHEVEGVVFATHLAFARVLDATWSRECARNFVQGLLDGEVERVFDFARELLASPTRRTGVVVHHRRAALDAAALATIAYVDVVTQPDSVLHRWAVLLRTGIPDDVLRGVELESRGGRGERVA